MSNLAITLTDLSGVHFDSEWHKQSEKVPNSQVVEWYSAGMH